MATTTARVIAEGRNFCEGLRWHEGRFWFSDFYAHEVCSIGLQGDVRVEADLGAEQPSGLGWLPDGELLVVGMTKRQVLRRRLDGTLVVHAELASIATFHANDMLVTPEGGAYVGDFGFDLDGYIEAHGIMGLFGALGTDPSPFLSRVTYVAPDGSASIAADALLFPNGMALLDGGRTLVVARRAMARSRSVCMAPLGCVRGELYPDRPPGVAPVTPRGPPSGRDDRPIRQQPHRTQLDLTGTEVPTGGACRSAANSLPLATHQQPPPPPCGAAHR